MMEQLQRQRNLATIQLRIKQEKLRLADLKLGLRAEKEADTVDKTTPSMQPVMDKLGKTIQRPARPL